MVTMNNDGSDDKVAQLVATHEKVLTEHGRIVTALLDNEAEGRLLENRLVMEELKHDKEFGTVNFKLTPLRKVISENLDFETLEDIEGHTIEHWPESADWPVERCDIAPFTLWTKEFIYTFEDDDNGVIEPDLCIPRNPPEDDAGVKDET